MNTTVRNVGLAATILSLFAVFLAAMGAHLIKMNGLADVWRTASSVHMFNAAALIGLAALLAYRESAVLKWAAWFIVMGTVVFCGSIYLHVLSGYQISGVTPAGGILLMSGWALAVMSFLRKT
jgi:uncharacterized membrane protein YgdD (TMEM256/DUF423 family)